MKLRQAVREQSPSLALQRAAADEIAALDAEIERLQKPITDPAVIEAAFAQDFEDEEAPHAC